MARVSPRFQGDASDVTSTQEVHRLKEEVEILRNELHRAEIELEDRCWVAPTVLQHWLQLTYELESLNVRYLPIYLWQKGIHFTQNQL
jgi:hypothetical protein